MAIKPIQVRLELVASEKGRIKAEIESIQPVITIKEIKAKGAIRSLKSDLNNAVKSSFTIKEIRAKGAIRSLKADLNKAFKSVDMKGLKDTISGIQKILNAQQKKSNPISQLKEYNSSQAAAMSSLSTAAKSADKHFEKMFTRLSNTKYFRSMRKELQSIRKDYEDIVDKGKAASVTDMNSVTNRYSGWIQKSSKIVAESEAAAKASSKLSSEQTAAIKVMGKYQAAMDKMISSKGFNSLSHEMQSKLMKEYESITASMEKNNERGASVRGASIDKSINRAKEFLKIVETEAAAIDKEKALAAEREKQSKILSPEQDTVIGMLNKNKKDLQSAYNSFIQSVADKDMLSSARNSFIKEMNDINSIITKGASLDVGVANQRITSSRNLTNSLKDQLATYKEVRAEASKMSAQQKSAMQVVSNSEKMLTSTFKKNISLFGGDEQSKYISKYSQLLAEAEQLRADGNSLDIEKAKKINAEMVKLDSTMKHSGDAVREAARAMKDYKKSMSDVEKSQKSLNDFLVRMQKYLDVNPRVARSGYGKQIKGWIDELTNLPFDKAVARMKEVQVLFSDMQRNMLSKGLTGKGFLDKASNVLSRFAGFTLAGAAYRGTVQSIREMVANIKDLDEAMTELKKVTDLSDSAYETFYENAGTRAKTYGATMVDTIKATADASRLGLDINEATTMANAAIVYKNVGDGIENIGDASNSLISTIQAFSNLGYTASDSMEIVDKFNEVGNNFAITSTGIGEALQRSAAAMSAGNNTLDETIGLITAANTVVQNPDSVGTMLKTVSMYLRAAKVEAEGAGESTEGMASSISSLRETVKSLTGGKVDIQLDEDTFKSTYQILKEISEVWDTMTDVDQAALLEKLGGKRNANAVSAMIANFDIAEQAMRKSSTSAGSALKENERYLDSIQGKLAEFNSTFETFSSELIGSEFVKSFIGFGTKALDIFTGLTKEVGGLPLLISAIISAATITKNVTGQGLSIFDLFGVNKDSGKLGLYGESNINRLFAPILKSQKNAKDQVINNAREIRTEYVDSFKSIWNGADSKAASSKAIDEFNKVNEKLSVLKRQRMISGMYKNQGIPITPLPSKNEFEEANNGVSEYIKNNEKLTEAQRKYFEYVRKNGLDASYKGFKSFSDKNGFALDESGLKGGLKRTVANIGNMMAGMATTMAVSFAFDLAITGVQKLYDHFAVTNENIKQATQNADNFNKSVSSINSTASSVDSLWDTINSSSAGSSERVAAYEQLRDIQAELISQYGQHASGLLNLTSSAQSAADSMNQLAEAEANAFFASNAEEIGVATYNMGKSIADLIGSNGLSIGKAMKELPDTSIVNDVETALEGIANKYDDVTFHRDAFGEGFLSFTSDIANAQGTINNVRKDLDDLKTDFAQRGIDISQVFSGLDNLDTTFAPVQKQVDDIRNEYGEIYDAAIQAELKRNDAYSKAVLDMTQKQDALSNAMSGVYESPEERVNAIRSALEDIQSTSVESLLNDEFGKNRSVDNYFANWKKQLDDSAKSAALEVDLSDLINIDTSNTSDVANGLANVKKEIESTFNGMSLGDIKELYTLFETTNDLNGTKYAEAFTIMEEASSNYSISVRELLDSLYDYNILAGDIADRSYDAAGAFSKVEEAFSSGNIFSGMAAAMKAQSEGGGTLSYDSYEALIASSAEYAKAVDFENGYMRLNVDLAKKLSDEKAKLALASINEQKANDEERYKANARAIEELIEKGDDLSNSRIRDLQAENDQITANIQKYNAYASTLKQISSGYYAFTQVSEADNSDVEFGKAGEAKKVIEEALNSGKTGVGNVQYQMALDFIIPDDVQQKGEKAVSDYMSTINRYMADEKQGMSNFLADMVTAGVATQEDGKIKLNADMTMDKFLEAFANAGGKIKPITEDVVDSMFGVINMYTDDEFKLVDPKDISNIMQAVSDFQKAQAEYKSAIGDENIAKKKEELSTYAEALKDIPEEQLTELGIKFVDGEGHAVSPDEIANAVNSGTTINVDENANHLINDLKKLSDLKNDIKIETDTSKVSELASDIENITDRINKTASEKFGFDAEITSVQGLADAYATVSENLEMYKSKRSLFEQKGLNTSELDTKISELESQKVELNAYMKLQGMDEVHAKISELKKNIEDTKAEIEHGAKVGANTEEAEQKLAAYERQLNAIGNTEVGAKVSSGDLDALYTQAEGVWQKIQEITKGDHTVKLSASEQGNVDELYSQLEELQQLINESGGELNIDFSFKGEEENGLVSVITEVAGEEYNLNLKVDQQALRDQVFSAFEGFDGLLDLPEQELPVEPIVEDDVEVPINPIVEGGSEAIKRAIDIISGDSEAEVGFTPTIKEGAESALDKIKEQFDAANVKVPVEYTPTNGDIGDFIGDQSPVEIPAEPKLTKSPEALGGEIKQIDVPIQPTIDNIKIAGNLSIGDIKAKINAMFAGFHPEVSVKAKVASEGNPNLSAIDAVKNAASKIANTAVKLQIDSNAPSVLGNLNSIASKKLPNKSFTVTEYHNIVTTGGGGNTHRWGVPAADGTKNAPGGRTLVGELGPELVVSNGQFYIAGQIGAEFVDLNKGDIVFNHKDTERILKGEPGARGRALSSGSISLDKLTGTSSSSSSSKSGSSSSSTAKALTSKASKSTENMDKKLEKLIKELSETLDNFDSAIKASLAEGGDIDAIIQTYRDALAAIEAQKEAYRKKGVKEDSKYMNDLKAQWYEYRDKMASSIKEYYDKLIDSQENFSKLREKSIENMLHSNDQSKIYEYMNDRLEAITKQQDLLHEQAERLREAGFLDTDKEVAELSLKWWDLQEDKIKAQVDIYDALIDRLEATNTLFERMRDNTTKDKNRDNTLDNDRNSAIIATNEMLKNLKFQREAIEEKLAAYAAMGYSQSSKEVLELKEEWYKVSDAVEDAREQIVDTLNEMASNTSELIEEVKNVFDVFHKAAEDYADNNGFISVDSYRDILELGPQYMQMLKDENGVLVINKEKIDGVIKALTEKAAVESALSYLEQVKIAYMFGETEMLDKLIYSTATTTEGTWGLVYANAALLKVLGLSDEQYEQLMWNLKAYQSIANNVKDGVSVVGSKDLDELKNGAEDLLDYVMDMIKHEIEEQVKALQKMKDDYADIIKLKKESLEITKKESDYQEEIADKLKEASKIQAQINALSLDDSREAIARRKELEENLAELQKDIAKDQADYALDRQKDMLDDSQDAYEKQKDEEIETLENTISSKEKLYRLAIERIETHWETIYSELIEWNTEYGNSLNKEITSTWELAKEAVNMYGYNFEEVISKMEARIKELKGELSDLGDTATNLIVGDLDGSNTSFLNEEAIKAIVSMMEQNSATWITDADGSHVSNQKLADELRKYGLDPYFNSRTGEWYTDSSMNKRLYDSYGDGFNSFNVGSVESNAAVIKMLVNKMKSNSAAWAGSSNEQRTKLSKQNIDIAKTLKSYGIDVGTSTDKSGAWIIKSDRLNPGNVGRRLYDVYHKGGIVGDAGTIKQNEMIAKLEKGEAVLDKKKESGVMRLLDFASSVADRVGSMMNNSSIGHMDLAVAGAFGSLQPVQAYTVNFGDTYITGTSDENISAHKKITRDFTNEVLKQLNIKR